MDKYYSIPNNLAAYAEQHTTGPSALLNRLERETYLKEINPRMLAGHYQGRLLTMISQMIRPKAVLEVGTFTGYSALCLAEGLQEGGVLHTIEVNEELEKRAKTYFERANKSHQIQMHIGDACEIIPTLDEVFDLVFLDADKQSYKRYYELVFDKVRNGGFIITDNVLWNGKVLEEVQDKETAAIHAFNQLLQADERIENILLPVRDGIMIARKKLNS